MGVKLAVKRDGGGKGKGGVEMLWQYFPDFHLTLKVMLPFDMFPSSCAVTLTRHEQSTSGTRSPWGCVVTAADHAIVQLHKQ